MIVIESIFRILLIRFQERKSEFEIHDFLEIQTDRDLREKFFSRFNTNDEASNTIE